MKGDLKAILERQFKLHHHPNFIPHDPISIPHRFTKKQDIEIMGFWTSILAWGLRKTIINKCSSLVEMMDGAPHQFILQHSEKDLKPFLAFKHRTFNATDTLYFIQWLRWYYEQNKSLEDAFARFIKKDDEHIGPALVGFHHLFFSLPDFPHRTRKHIASPERNSTCKRLNMFLRWMVRSSKGGVDFGIWKEIKPSQLLCPLDVHVERVARELGLITRKQRDWKTVLELTERLKEIDSEDPVKYDLALFGMGVNQSF